MEKTRKRKKECSVTGCRKIAVDGGKCRLHTDVEEVAAEEVVERVMPGRGMHSTAKKINRIRKANKPKESEPVAPLEEHHGKTSKSHVAEHKRDGFNAICFSAGNILGRLGAYLEGK